MRFRRSTLQQRGGQPRLAYARFAGKQHHLSFACLCLRPAPQQQIEFFFASDKFGEAGCVESVETALDGRWSQCGPSSYGSSDTLEFLGPKVFKLEEVTD